MQVEINIHPLAQYGTTGSPYNPAPILKSLAAAGLITLEAVAMTVSMPSGDLNTPETETIRLADWNLDMDSTNDTGTVAPSSSQR